MDKIVLPQIEILANHGVNRQEKTSRQPFIISATIWLDLEAARQGDDLTQTIDYGLLYERIKAFAENSSFNLIETLAGSIIDLVFEDKRASKVRVKVKKTQARTANCVFPAAVVMERARGAERVDKKTTK
jgi:FolB domain-containing protein